MPATAQTRQPKSRAPTQRRQTAYRSLTTKDAKNTKNSCLHFVLVVCFVVHTQDTSCPDCNARTRTVAYDPALMPTVREATHCLMRELGLTTIFGNPGSTELPLFR